MAGAALLWHGASPPRAAKPAATSEEMAEAEGLRPTSLLVDFRDDASAAAMAAPGYDEQPLSDYSARDHLYRVDFATADEAAAARAKLAANPDVESVDYDSLATIPADEQAQEFTATGNSMEAECAAAAHDGGGFPNDACFKYQWHLRQIGAPAAWKETNGKGAVVAVIDTGVTKVGDLAQTKFVPGYNFLTNSADASDDHGHGTHVAGTIAQSTNNGLGVAGVAYGASIMPLKVLSARGSGSMGGIAQAIRWAADHGANVINMSLGGPFAVATISSAIKYAHDKGVVVVAAAGNDGRGRVGFPARAPGVIAVAATQFDEKTTFYSNWGSEVDISGSRRQHARRPERRRPPGRRPSAHDRAERHHAHGLPVVHGDVDGVAPRRRRGRPGGQRGRAPSGGGRADPARDRAQAPPRRRRTRRGSTTTTAPASSTRRRPSPRRARGAAPRSWAWAWRPACWRWRCCAAAASRPSDSAGARWPRSSSARRASTSAGRSRSRGRTFTARPHALSGGFTDLARGPISATLVYSAIAPVGLIVLLYGVRRLRPVLAGFGFGVAGALLFAAVGHTVSLRFIPDALEPLWMAGQATVTALFAAACLRKN